METGEVVDVLEEIAVLLELKGENPFKSRAYTSAARALETCPTPVAELVAEGTLSGLKGVGKALVEKVTILVETGKLPYYEDLKASFPEGFLDLLKIPGFGPKKLALVHDKLGVTNFEQLEAVCQDGSVAGLPRFGKKTAENILTGIEQIRKFSSQHRYGDVIDVANELVDSLRYHPAVTRVSITGSLRRGKEVVKDIDLIVSSKHPKAIMEFFVNWPDVERVTGHGETKSSVVLQDGLQCDLRVVDDSIFPYTLAHFTGSKEHNVRLRQRAISQGRKLSEYGLFDVDEKTGEETLIECHDERELHEALDLQFIVPELREDMGEVEAADKKALPRLVDWGDLKGTFHNHTAASDGESTLEQMANAADQMGLEYLGISDHSKSQVQANGLHADRLLKQVEEIKALNKKNKKDGGIHVFAGNEVDILSDGSLDYPDEVLAELDYVVASVHSSFQLKEAEMTKRIIRAMENPYVTMLGHVSGRLLLRREAYALNIPKIIDAAAATGTWIEINASPWRLDMDWRFWHQARDKGVKCVINPDAHSVRQLGYLIIGAQIARKGWLRKEDVLNTLPLSKMKTLLKKSKKGK